MKKTLIALLALGSVAMATDPSDMNDALAQEILKSGYKNGDSFEFSVDFTKIATSGTKTMLTLIPDQLYLNSQVANYVGLATTVNGDPSSWDTYRPSETLTSQVGDNTVYTNVMSGTGAAAGWLTYKKDRTNGNAISLNNSSFTLSYDAVKQTAILTYALAPASGEQLVEQLALSNIEFNANNIQFYTGVTASNFQSGNLVFNKSVPEPATSTLSLLALAALAARRRRK